MAFKPSYNQLRSERTRAKARKQQEKLQRREEESARRNAARDRQQASDSGPENPSK